MRVFYLIFLTLFMIIFHAVPQKRAEDFLLSGTVLTLQVKDHNTLFNKNFIELKSNDRLLFSFDKLTHQSENISYEIIHCDANWNPSALSVFEYMEGFSRLPVMEYSYSSGTTIPYIHYKLEIPNQEIKLRAPGNYMLRLYYENNPETELLSTRFYVVDTQTGISATIEREQHTSSDKPHQQVNFTLNTHTLINPENLIIKVLQNNLPSDKPGTVKPSGLGNNLIKYEQLPEFLFEAGNEFRKAEFRSHNFIGLHVEDIQYKKSFYQIILNKDYIRTGQKYVFDEDQNGCFTIGCDRCRNPDVEADYFQVIFRLKCDEINGGEIYLNGEFTQNQFNKHTLIEYDEVEKIYRKTCLLKAGHYNYRYLFKFAGKMQTATEQIEGNFPETSNEYTIYIYHREPGSRYDQLIGIQTIR